MMDFIKNQWQGFQPRERWVLALGVLFCLGLLFHQLIWAPWQNAINFMEQALVGHRTNLTWMRQQAQLLDGSGAAVTQKTLKGRDQSLMSVIEQSARKAGVQGAIQQLVPREQNTQVSVVLEGASFNNWVRWVDALQSEYGVKIAQLGAEREDKPDKAEIRVTFYRG